MDSIVALQQLCGCSDTAIGDLLDGVLSSRWGYFSPIRSQQCISWHWHPPACCTRLIVLKFLESVVSSSVGVEVLLIIPLDALADIAPSLVSWSVSCWVLLTVISSWFHGLNESILGWNYLDALAKTWAFSSWVGLDPLLENYCRNCHHHS